MMPICAAGELAAHPRLRLAAGLVIRRRPRYAAGEIDHEADRELGNGLHEAGAGAGHEHAGLRGGIDIDVADVDGAADEGTQARQLRKDLAAAFGHAIGDDDVGIFRRMHEAGRDRASRSPSCRITSAIARRPFRLRSP